MVIVIAGAHSPRLIRAALPAALVLANTAFFGDPYLFPRDVESPERTISLGLRFRL